MSLILDVYSLDGKKIGDIELDSTLFDGKVNESLLWEAVKMYEANLRQGTVSTKTRGEVRGGGRKPYSQKGTGRARHGSQRSPIWKGGGVVFGPKPRDFYYTVPRKKKVKALLSALNARLNENSVKVLDKFNIGEIKTKKVVDILRKLGLKGTSTIIVDSELSEEAKLSVRNIPRVNITAGSDLNAYQVVLHRAVVFTQEAITQLQDRIRKGLESRKTVGVKGEVK